MRTALSALFMIILFGACTSKGPPPNPNTGPPLPESSGAIPSTEQQGAAFSISTEVHYQASLKSISTPGKVISLNLTPKGAARMTTDYLDKNPVVVDTGSWTTLNTGNLLLNLRRIGDKDSISLEFKTDGEKLVYTGSDFGAEGLTLFVKPVAESN